MTYKNEKEKYIDLYSGKLSELYVTHDDRGRTDGGYGRANWGENIAKIIKDSNIKSLLDFGCGYGRFCDLVSEFVDEVYGADIASVCTGNVIDNKKIKFIDTDGKSISLGDKTVEMVTSFDCLEHVAEDDLDVVLDEFKRVAIKGFVVSVAPVVDNFFNVPLHLTIKPISWWVEKFSKYGKVSMAGTTPLTNLPYIVCKF